MNIFTNSGKTKKFILILVVLLLFNFCFPKTVKAAGWFDDLLDHIAALPARIVWWIEEGILILLNDIFSDSDAQVEYGHTINGRHYL